jgi:hypothetical protein
MSQPTPAEPRPIATAPRRHRSILPWVALVLLLGGGAAMFFLLGQPKLVFTNRLIQPVRLAVGGDPARTVPPGGEVTVPLARGRAVVAEWAAVPPSLTDGRLLGEQLRGRFSADVPRGTLRAEASPVLGGSVYFAPILTNASGSPLDIRVNAGLTGARDCCTLPAGAQRVPAGYWPLYRNSTVEARTADGRAATFQSLGPEVRLASGALRLRFSAADLRR